MDEWDVELVGETDFHAVCYVHDWESESYSWIGDAFQSLADHWKDSHTLQQT